MKWVAFLLLAANVAYPAWRIRSPSPVAPSARARPTQSGPRLVLLSEIPKARLRRREIAVLPQPAAVSDPGTARRCFSAGGVSDTAQVDRMQAWFEGHGAKVLSRTVERREMPLYWLYLPPLPSRAAAEGRVHSLEQEGIGDIYLIPDGDMRNAISLGLYAHRTSLARRQAQLHANGYDPTEAIRYRSAVGTWLDVAFPASSKPDPEAFKSAFPDAAVQATPCPQRTGTGAAGASEGTPAPDGAATPPATGGATVTD